jgi:hypothetical protein
MALAPAAWSKLKEDERTRIAIEPFVGLFDGPDLAPCKGKADFDDMFDAQVCILPNACPSVARIARKFPGRRIQISWINDPG